MNSLLDSYYLFDVEFTHDDCLIGSFTSSLRTAERRSCESCQFDHVSESRSRSKGLNFGRRDCRNTLCQLGSSAWRGVRLMALKLHTFDAEFEL
ncbi:hypothetical protein PILCRDRAFT_819729 [Piloderma croceum F 1598]|uniref:Uncharacterized protein n=1 Tax=Piloderma croceum (strain F 1598) TaxID=765440 RepID=A0A0C3FWR9_PILCF|nr:hypothetical protein PILCRDRAFT_819729 [Piloderma croceum F 1598]